MAPFAKKRKRAETTPDTNTMKPPTVFQMKVYDACRKIPKGKVSTYGNLALYLGDASLSRAVGSALRKNPFAPEVPCHRVVNSNGKLGGFYGSKDLEGDLLHKKVLMLVEEGVQFVNKQGKDIKDLSINSDLKDLEVKYSCIEKLLC